MALQQVYNSPNQADNQGKLDKAKHKVFEPIIVHHPTSFLILTVFPKVITARFKKAFTITKEPEKALTQW